MRQIIHRVAGILSLVLLVACTATETGVSIVQTEEGSRIAVDGTPLYIKGIGGANRLDVAAAAGANAFRTWGGTVESIRKDIEKASEQGMYILQGIGMSKQLADYEDEGYKERKREEVRLLAETFKDAPEIFAWGVGNEIELGNANAAVTWQFVDELAQIIKSVDKRHLVSCVLCNPFALDSIEAYAPNLDFVGMNSYGGIDKLGEFINRSSYKRPFMVTEWGPSGFWEMPSTDWKAPIEQTSEEKRIVYEERYNNYILGNPRCMGSFVFLWGQKEERTPTWFSMFVEKDVEGLPLQGEKTPMVEAMQRVWSGKEPEQTAPVLQSFRLNGKVATESVVAPVNGTLAAEVMAVDRENDRLTYVWEILQEATVLGFGGSYEPRPNRVGEVTVTQDAGYTFSLPSAGNYRLYVYVKDNTGFVATANIPFKVE